MSPEELIAGADAVVFDFDRSLCGLFAGVAAAAVADELYRYLSLSSAAGDFDPNDGDPFELVRRARKHSLTLSRQLSWRLALRERQAVSEAVKTSGGEEVVARLATMGKILAIASDNDRTAMDAWLERNQLQSSFLHVEGRSMWPERMQPDPHSLHETCKALDLSADQCLFIGNSLAGAQAADAAAMPHIAYANEPNLKAIFEASGHQVVIESLSELLG